MPEDIRAVDLTGILDDHAPADESKHVETEDREELAKKLKDKFTQSYEARLPYERDWELYRLYLKGEQLIVRHRDTGEIVRLSSEDSKRLRSVNNVLRPTARSLVGKLTRTIPTCTVLPATADFEEQHGAKVAEALLQYARRKEDLDLKYLETVEYLPWAGNGFLQLEWDAQEGRELAYCEICSYNSDELDEVNQPCPQCSMQREQEMELQQVQAETQKMQALSQVLDQLPPDVQPSEDMIPQEALQPPPLEQHGALPTDMEPQPLVKVTEGDFKIHVRDTRNVYVEPGSESIKDAGWVCIRVASRVSDVRRRFPMHAEHLKAEDNIYLERTADLRYNSVDSYGEIEYLDDHCYVYEFHERPTWNYPKGRVIFMVNDKIVRLLEESPYWSVLGRFPLYHFGFDKNCGEFWYEPFCAQAWHRQREINQIETQIREHVELGLKPKMLNPIGSRITQEEITATSDQIIKYNAAAGMPTFLQFPPMSEQVFGRRNELAADIRQQAAVTEQEAGMSQSDPNGRAMAIIEAEADQQVGPILLRNHSEWRELHRGILQVFQAYAHPDRIWTIAGDDGVQIFSFNEMSLSPGFDVQVEQEDGLSRNPAIRQQQALDLLNAGVFLDPMTGMPDMKAFLRHAKIRLPKAGYDLESTERAAASQVPYLIEKGEQHTPMPYNDPEIFAEVLLGWLRGPGRRKPEIAQQVLQLWMYYMQWATMGQPPPGMMQPMGGGQSAPGAGPGGPDMSAQGGSANGPGHMGSDVRASAQNQVQRADARGEQAAQVQSQREG